MYQDGNRSGRTDIGFPYTFSRGAQRRQCNAVITAQRHEASACCRYVDDDAAPSGVGGRLSQLEKMLRSSAAEQERVSNGVTGDVGRSL